jgi:hypothetical protein
VRNISSNVVTVALCRASFTVALQVGQVYGLELEVDREEEAFLYWWPNHSFKQAPQNVCRQSISVRGWNNNSVQMKHCNSRSRLSRPELAAVLVTAIAGFESSKLGVMLELRSLLFDCKCSVRSVLCETCHQATKKRRAGFPSTCLAVRCIVSLALHWAKRHFGGSVNSAVFMVPHPTKLLPTYNSLCLDNEARSCYHLTRDDIAIRRSIICVEHYTK